jgi:hypothetical protein
VTPVDKSECETRRCCVTRGGSKRECGSWDWMMYVGADKSLARPGRKQATATEDFDVHISYL